MTTTIAGGGPLHGLIRYYERLQNDPQEKIADYGFAVQGAGFCILLEPDGTVPEDFLIDIRRVVAAGKGKTRRVSEPLTVPFRGNRSGQRPPPNFLCDNSGYVLGFDEKTKPALLEWKHDQFVQFHLGFRDVIDDAGYQAVCRFLEGWSPERSKSISQIKELVHENIVFRLRGVKSYVHDSPRVKHAWSKFLAANETTFNGFSLLTGDDEPLARLHEPAIKGVYDPGGQAEKRIVSFNNDAFTSFGLDQSYNAPVGVRDAFRYTTALNRLLSDNRRRTRIGDATVVFWADRNEGEAAELVMQAFFGDDAPRSHAAEDAQLKDRLRAFLKAAQQGLLRDQIADPEAPFYILGLSPNASRLHVRYWLVATVEELAQRLARHQADLAIATEDSVVSDLTLQKVVSATARQDKEVSPSLAGALTRAVLFGTPYPETLLSAVIRRIRVEQGVSTVRAAIIKAFILRNGDVSMDAYLNKEHPDKAYHCGRLFAVLAFAQQEALGQVNASIIQRNFAAAMASPGVVLGRLIRTTEVAHISKLEGDLPTFLRDELQAISISLKDGLPITLDLRHQGLFALGFYQESHHLKATGPLVKSKRRYRTAQGEWVRSKLEVRVADMLSRHGLAYLYEPRAMLPSGQEQWPDFVIRGNSRERDCYIEVLGMNTPEYNQRWEQKLQAYEQIGILTTGGTCGRLAIIDARQSKIGDLEILEAIRFLTPGIETDGTLANEGSDQ